MRRLCTETSRSYLGRSAARAVTDGERKVAGLSQSQSTSADAGCHASRAIEQTATFSNRNSAAVSNGRCDTAEVSRDHSSRASCGAAKGRTTNHKEQPE